MAAEWRLFPAAHVSPCPLLDAFQQQRFTRARHNATGGLVPRFIGADVVRSKFSPRRLLSLLAGRTLLLLGDSVTEQCATRKKYSAGVAFDRGARARLASSQALSRHRVCTAWRGRRDANVVAAQCGGGRALQDALVPPL